MDWSPESVLDFRPTTHRRDLRLAKRTYLLWPVWGWRVVTPEIDAVPLNVLQRAVLRFRMAGVREYIRIGDLLGVDRELVALVAEELSTTKALDAAGSVTDLGHRLLEESSFDSKETRVGWVFQDTYNGRVLPRFVTRLEYAEIESDDNGSAHLAWGSKGSPKKSWAFVLRKGHSTPTPPEPREVIEAARRHRRHERRLRRAGLDLDAVPAEMIRQVSLVSDKPAPFHLLSFVYVPESVADEAERWYVADPFGFGASPPMRDQLDKIRLQARAKERDILDKITGEDGTHRSEDWLAMQLLIHEQASRELAEEWPVNDVVNDASVRERLEAAFAELIRLEQEGAAGMKVLGRLDGAYLKLRQALEEALTLVRRAYPPNDSWRRLYEGEKRWIPADARHGAVQQCARACGFEGTLPDALGGSNPGKVKAVCLRAGSANLRPLCTALILAGAGQPDHPFRRLAAQAPYWLTEFNQLAEISASQVHLGKSQPTLEELRAQIGNGVQICRQVLAALAS